jgi:hypothetical protein
MLQIQYRKLKFEEKIVLFTFYGGFPRGIISEWMAHGWHTGAKMQRTGIDGYR